MAAGVARFRMHCFEAAAADDDDDDDVGLTVSEKAFECTRKIKITN